MMRGEIGFLSVALFAVSVASASVIAAFVALEFPSKPPRREAKFKEPEVMHVYIKGQL